LTFYKNYLISYINLKKGPLNMNLGILIDQNYYLHNPKAELYNDKK